MAGILSGLSNLGLGKLEGMDVFAKGEKQEEKQEEVKKPVALTVNEKELIYDKNLQCPVCDNKFTTKIVKTGKAKIMGTDFDLRPRYEGIDPVKYDVWLCPNCGYAALGRYFTSVGSGQAKLIRENISRNVQLHRYDGDIYTYGEAVERYKLCLANAVVKKAKTSEKAYICLKSAWLLRGYQEELMSDAEQKEAELKELKQEEESYLQNALEGFAEARSTEASPICGMDEHTVDYLLAQLYFHFKKYDMSARLVSELLTSRTTSNHIKDKARDLKEKIIAAAKK
ncbi:MAG: DUF2225 domain-containing protein [Lachnospiraceae bacterium]|nr:DUF2225 domain-containing protein [Lachnospiraceae bacterium]